MNDMINLSKT